MRIVWPRAAALAVALASMGCGSGSAPPSTEPPPKQQPEGCQPGEATETDGSCLAAGIPADACASGFEPDERGGCTAVLPAEACPDGQMAAPGDAKCRAVAECGEGTWGDIPVDDDTVYVDAAYAGGAASDGSAETPWTTIAEAVDAAPYGAIVAIAAGTYVENVILASKGLKLWGRCPELVEIQGATPGFTVDLRTGGGELHTLAVTGKGVGVAITNALDVALDRLWIHDTADIGAYFSNALGTARGTVTGTLVESCGSYGIYVEGVEALVQGSVVREGKATPYGPGMGVGCIESQSLGAVPGKLALSGSLVEAAHGIGVFVGGSEATIDGTVVRDIEVDAAMQGGFGIEISHSPKNKAASAVITGTVVQRSRGLGIAVYGSNATFDASAVLDVLSDPEKKGGRGIYAVENRETGERSQLTVTRSLVDHARETGISVVGSDASITSTWIRDTQPEELAGRGGGAIAAVLGPDTGNRPHVTVQSSLLEGSTAVGLYLSDADVELVSSLVRDTKPSPEGLYGDGVGLVRYAEDPATLVIEGSRIESSARAAVANFAGAASVKTTTLACNQIDLDGEAMFGRDFAFDDKGGNACGCPGEVECKVLTSNLEAPEPLEPIP